MRRFFFLIFISATLATQAATYVVTNTADSGDGSLRAALTSVANSMIGTTSITFNIPTSDAGYDAATGTWTIRPMSNLPYIVMGRNITIDGTSQTTYAGNTNPSGPEIVIEAGTTGLSAGIGIIGDYNHVKGLAIGGFEYGVMLYGSEHSTVSDCYLGVKADGQSATMPNTYGLGVSGDIDGVPMFGYDAGVSSHITVSGNVISGNTIAGIAIVGASYVTVTGNKIGCDRTGTYAMPNNQGIYITSAAHDNCIGGENETDRNIISGNTDAAVVMDGMNVRNNVVKGNYIGLAVSGAVPLSNHYGVIIQAMANSNVVGGNTAGARNVISANSEIGVYIQSADSNHVCGNYIGIDKSGTFTFVDERDTSLQANGVEINSDGRNNVIGGSTEAERNIISGNKVYGCIYYGHCAYNNIAGNYIGTDVTGSVAIPNATGICVDGSSNHNTMENNLLSGNRSYGLFIVTRETDSNIFRGNYVGCDATGQLALPNDVGLMLAADAKGNYIENNIFSGNRYAGIEVTDYGTDGNIITGNRIGTNAAGTAALPNENGIIVSALVHDLDISNNIISSNSQFGVVLTDKADNVHVYNNKIGVGVTLEPLGNGSTGVLVSGGAHDNTIGGHGEGNIIAYNDTAAIMLMDSNTVNNRISQNAIYGNGMAGIDIYPWGDNANDEGDTDEGCNHLMNCPQIMSVVRDRNDGHTVVSGAIDCINPQLCEIELFVAYNPSSLVREGYRYVASVTPNDNGRWTASVSGLGAEEVLVATATDSNGNTSEYSLYAASTLDIDESRQNLHYLAYPNPTTGRCLIIFPSHEAGIQVLNIVGQDVTAQTVVNRQAEDTVSVNMSSCPSGVYFIKVSARDGSCQTWKIEKK